MEVLENAYFIMSFSMVLHDVFPKDTKFANHITDWLHFHCCFGFRENNSSVEKRPPANARSRLSATYLRLLATDVPERLSAGMQFWYPYRNVEIYRYHRAQEN